MNVDVVAGWDKGTFSFEGFTHDTYRRGKGPGVVVMHEMPGLTPNVAAFGNRVVDAGFTVVMPHLFGEVGRPPTPGYVLKSMLGGCVSSEFANWALKTTSPKTRWCRSLARSLHEELGGKGVGAVGMCFTGGFALAMMVDDAVVAPVLSQPSLPFAAGKARSADLNLSDDDLARIKERAKQGQCVLGLRFTGDPAVPAARFERLRQELGDRFMAVEIDSSKGNPAGVPRTAHSVLTEHLVDRPGHPTHDALERVLAFFGERLK
ncbi:MAG: dienelactone hydrolase family protein [Polyangiaceae bacterium]|jgi:dienelactone hydrolase|nr:dienelactone hydrolase family protein [Polyangiaceae bacterium]